MRFIYNIIMSFVMLLSAIIMIALRHFPAIGFFYALYQTFNTGTEPWVVYASVFAVLELAVLHIQFSKKNH